MKHRDFPLERQFMDELGNLLEGISGALYILRRSRDANLHLVYRTPLGDDFLFHDDNIGQEIVSDSLKRNLDDPGIGIRDTFTPEVRDLFDLIIDFNVDITVLEDGKISLAFPNGYLETEAVLDAQSCRYLSGTFEEHFYPHKEVPF